MTLYPIVLANQPVLLEKSASVKNIDGSLRQLLDDMLETMYDAPGIGLAAPQIGISARIVVVDCSDDDEPSEPLKMINPEIIWKSDDTATRQEGCLSIPEYYAEITRPATIGLRYFDENGVSKERQAEGLLATCIQHEIDHLDGVLFIDYLSRLKRKMILRKMAKYAHSTTDEHSIKDTQPQRDLNSRHVLSNLARAVKDTQPQRDSNSRHVLSNLARAVKDTQPQRDSNSRHVLSNLAHAVKDTQPQRDSNSRHVLSNLARAVKDTQPQRDR